MLPFPSNHSATSQRRNAPTADEHAVVVEADEGADEGRVALSRGNARVGRDDAVHDLRVAAGVRVLAEQTVGAVRARLELTAPLENRVVDGPIPHST